MKLQEILKNNLHKAEAQLLWSESTLQAHNSICVFPDTLLTVCRGESGKPEISSKVIASQFTPEAAKEICANITNGRNESPVIMTVKEYYTAQIKSINELIKEL